MLVVRFIETHLTSATGRLVVKRTGTLFKLLNLNAKMTLTQQVQTTIEQYGLSHPTAACEYGVNDAMIFW